MFLFDKLENKKRELNTVIDTLEKNIEIKKNIIDNLENNLKKLKKENDTLSIEINNLQERKNILNTELANRENFFMETELKFIDVVNGIEFEHYFSKLLERIGYKSYVTKSSQDNGVDIIAEIDGKHTVIQCKRYSSTVGNKAVQEIYTAKGLYNANDGIVVTNNYFSSQAKEEAKKLKITLWDREVLKILIKKSYNHTLQILDSSAKDIANIEYDNDNSDDILLNDAVELAVNMGQISASMIQRKFKVGYARAGKIIDQMEKHGIISDHDGSKPRQTLISKEDWKIKK